MCNHYFIIYDWGGGVRENKVTVIGGTYVDHHILGL